jgi:TIR domain
MPPRQAPDSERQQKRRSSTPESVVRRSLEKVNVFISYASSDNEIAKILREELIDIDRNRVNCFLDSETIASGEGWRNKLDMALDEADWLVCLFTGEQSDFCGYEIEVFTKAKVQNPRGGDARFVCLHDQPELPAVFSSHQNKLIVFPPEPTSTTEPFDAPGFYSQSPIAKFFSDFCTYKELYVARGVSDSGRQLQTIAQKAKRITDAFKATRGKDIRADTPTQPGIEVRVTAAPDEKLVGIPPEATVTGTFESFALFGLMPPMVQRQLPTTTWGWVREACSSPHNTIVPWMEP